MVGAYIGFWSYLVLSGPLGLGPAVSPLVIVVGIPLSALALYLIAAGIFRVALKPVLRQPELNQMLLTFGLSIVIVNAMSITFTAQAQDANLAWRFALLGIAEQVISQYVPNGAALRDGLFFVLIFVVLLARPAGLRR